MSTQALYTQEPMTECWGCRRLEKSINRQPEELRYGVWTNKEDDIFVINDYPKWMKRILRRWRAGMRMEMVTVSDSVCQPDIDTLILYTQLENHFKREMKKGAPFSGDSTYLILPVGEVPEKYRTKSYDINIIFTKRRKNCRRVTFYPIYEDNYRLGLFYRQDTDKALQSFLNSIKVDLDPIIDTLNYVTNYAQSKNQPDTIFTFYNQDTITGHHYISHPITYDTALIEDIVSVELVTFASIEGVSDKNLLLARLRAENLKQQLVEWGVDSTIFDIRYSENWELYKKQIQTDKYASLKKYSQQQVKDLLNDKSVQKRVADLLDKQRESYITFHTERTHPIKKMSNEELIEALNTSFANKDYRLAFKLRYELYFRVVNRQMLQAHLYRLIVADTLDYLNKHRYFKHLLNPETETYMADKIETLLLGNKKDGELQFYRMRHKTIELSLKDEKRTRFKTKREINSLKKYGVPKEQINRLLINYYFELAEQYRYSGNIKTKNRTLGTTYKLVRKINLSQDEKLGIAKFYDFMLNRELAIKTLQPEINKATYNEELLFTYLFLTLPNQEYFKDNSYMLLINHALELNKDRFADFFDPSIFGVGAIKLLEDPEMRKIYCEECK